VALDLAKIGKRAVRQIVRAFQPFDALDTDAADQLQPIRCEVPGFVVVAYRASGMGVARLEPQRRIRPGRAVVRGVALTGAVVGMAAGHAGHAPIHQANPTVEHRLRLSGGL